MFSRLKLANLEVAENEELKKNVSEVLGETYEGNVDIYHLPQVIIEKNRVKRN